MLGLGSLGSGLAQYVKGHEARPAPNVDHRERSQPDLGCGLSIALPATIRVANRGCLGYAAATKVAVGCKMKLTEMQINDIAKEFMPRIREESVVAMVHVVCEGKTVLRAAQDNNVTHQSLLKNLKKLEQLEGKIKMSETETMKMIMGSEKLRKIYNKAINSDYSFDFPGESLEETITFSVYVGLNNSDSLKDFIDHSYDEMQEFMVFLYKIHNQRRGVKWRISLCFIVQLMLIKEHYEKLNVEYLCKSGWDEDIAKIVVDASLQWKSHITRGC